MSKQNNIQALHSILLARRTPIHQSELAERIGCSEKSIKRYIRCLRDEMNAPIQTPKAAYYIYDKDLRDTFVFPEFFISLDDVQSMALMLKLLKEYTSTLMSDDMQRIEKTLRKVIIKKGLCADDLERAIKIVPINHDISHPHLHSITQALLNQQCIRLSYKSYDGHTSHRQISPQRLFYYRDHWYLDAYCHHKKALRIFKTSRTLSVSELPQLEYKRVAADVIDKHVSSGYGVFAGAATQNAVLEFAHPVADDVANQQWHPEQTGTWKDGYYELRLPYAQDHELIQDILRYVPYVTVIQPASLKNAVIERLSQALDAYRS